MIGTMGHVRVFAYAAPCDMRRSYEGLHAIVRNELKRSILDGELFVFTNKRRNRCKVLFFDSCEVPGYVELEWRSRRPETIRLVEHFT